MALIVSTILEGTLTPSIHGAINAEMGSDYVLKKYKNALALSRSGTQITIQSGAACIGGTIVTSDSSSYATIPTSSGSNYKGYLVLRLTMGAKLENANAEFKCIYGTSYPAVGSGTNNINQGDPVNNSGATRDIVLASYETTGTTVTSFVDSRGIATRKFEQIDYGYFKTINQVLSSNKILSLSKVSGGIGLSGTNIALEDGYYYEFFIEFMIRYTGWAYFGLTDTSGSSLPIGDSRGFTITPERVDVFSPKGITGVIDWSGGIKGISKQIQMRTFGVSDAPEVMAYSDILIKKYLVNG